MSDQPRAWIDANGVLHDPDALAMIRAVERENCRQLLIGPFRERLEHFKRRVHDRGLLPHQVVIVFLNMDDPRGSVVGNILMPAPPKFWEDIRARGETPYARGLAERDGIQRMVDDIDGFTEEADRLRAARCYAILMMDRGIVACFDYEEIR